MWELNLNKGERVHVVELLGACEHYITLLLCQLG